jgi:hypothetical protein
VLVSFDRFWFGGGLTGLKTPLPDFRVKLESSDHQLFRCQTSQENREDLIGVAKILKTSLLSLGEY